MRAAFFSGVSIALFISLMSARSTTAALPTPASQQQGNTTSSTSVTTNSAEKVSLRERAYIASRIYSALVTYFAHWDNLRGFDLDAEYKKYLEVALSSDSRIDFDLATMHFMAQFKNGHTRFEDFWFLKENGQPIGFMAQAMDGDWVITNSQVNGLKPGDLLASINDMDVSSFVAAKTAFIGGSSVKSAQRVLFYDNFLFPQEISLVLKDGRKVFINRRELKPLTSIFMPSSRWIEEGHIAYIKIPSFGRDEYEQAAVDAVKQYSTAKTIIVDVRGNTGGNTPVKLLAALMDRSYRSWAQATTMSVFPLQLPPETHMRMALNASVDQPSKTHFTGRLLILIDSLCASACEDFAMPFKDNHRATLLGETSSGTTGQPYFLEFENGMSIAVGATREYFPDGAEFEGVGVSPDVDVPLHATDLRTGQDPVLRKAIELAGNR